MDLLSLLSAPVPYLEQEQYEFNTQNKEGLTVLHYAALTMSFDWLQSALDVKQDNFIKNLSTNTKYSSIPLEHIPQLGTSTNKLKSKGNQTNTSSIPFGTKGYSVPHLLIWMMSHYEKETHIERHDKIKQISDLLNDWISKDINILKIKDGNGVSVTEYALMLNQEQILEPYISHIICLDFFPKLKDETLNKLSCDKNAKNQSLRKEICDQIFMCRKKEAIDLFFAQKSAIEVETEEQDFKL